MVDCSIPGAVTHLLVLHYDVLQVKYMNMFERNRLSLILSPEGERYPFDVIDLKSQRMPDAVRIEVLAEDEQSFVFGVHKEGHGQRLFLNEAEPPLEHVTLVPHNREVWIPKNEIRRGEYFSISTIEPTLARTAFKAEQIFANARRPTELD